MESASAFTELLSSIRQSASTATSLLSLQESIVQVISQTLPHYDWVGFYMLDPSDSEMLILGPFAGAPTPHVRIPVNQGICGAAVASQATIVVDDVSADPRYLSCSISTRSEIVVPVFVSESVVGEIDIDSHTAAAFTDRDRAFLEEVARIVGNYIARNQAAADY
jgi:L-methionine (R)-S-oxide reductase